MRAEPRLPTPRLPTPRLPTPPTPRTPTPRTPDSPHLLNPVLLHGVTGSGKTEIYMRAIEFAIQMGQRAIILVPEIALTPQMVRRFSARFPGQVAITHSKLTDGERYDTWRRASARHVRHHHWSTLCPIHPP